MTNVSGVIKSIQDIMRKDVGVDGDAQRISQLVWMFFLKILDDREAELELIDDDFQSPLPDHLRWRNWAADRQGDTGEKLLDFVNDTLFPRLKGGDLPTQGAVGRRAQIIRDVFEDTYNYMKSGTLLRQVINKINEIDFNNSEDRHTFGAIYEQVLKDLQSAGNAGEFYTPRAVTRFIIDRLNPRLDEVVFDPACGTGGFLTCAIDHKRKAINAPDDEEMLHRTIRGVEKKALPHMLCVTNMILHGIDTPSGIRHGNTLARAYTDYSEKDRVPVIATNPPFGGMEEDGIENNFPSHLRTRETADLFMALIIRMLKTGGRAAVVLPDGFLFGEGVKSTLKQSLIEECNLHTIVRLPNGVFAPYTGIKTNILFFTKGTPTKNVWFYEHPYPDGVTSYNKTKPMRFEEFAPERAWWADEADGFRDRKETEQAWKISAADVAARGYNLDLKNPHTPEVESHDPDELLARYAQQQQSIQSIRDQLKGILADALGVKP
ncbi:MAG: SAM-dependent DNA methyltransferase [Novosphingobium sp.]|nr:SAM-dependent DNA methyltransferase [Novosphingobium sp.]